MHESELLTFTRHCHANCRGVTTNNLFAVRYQLYMPKREDVWAQMDYIMQHNDVEKD